MGTGQGRSSSAHLPVPSSHPTVQAPRPHRELRSGRLARGAAAFAPWLGRAAQCAKPRDAAAAAGGAGADAGTPAAGAAAAAGTGTRAGAGEGAPEVPQRRPPGRRTAVAAARPGLGVCAGCRGAAHVGGGNLELLGGLRWRFPDIVVRHHPQALMSLEKFPALSSCHIARHGRARGTDSVTLSHWRHARSSQSSLDTLY